MSQESRVFHEKWNQDCTLAFQRLKEKLTSAPVLAHPDFTKPFVVETDASFRGMGAVLSQEDGVIAYASCGLRPTERNDANNSSMKLELLALKWAVTEKFNPYLIGSHFTVYTENNPLSSKHRIWEPLSCAGLPNLLSLIIKSNTAVDGPVPKLMPSVGRHGMENLHQLR